MNVSLYQAAAAMNAESRWQELITQNLAAGATPGFRKQDVSFEDVAASSPLAMNGATPTNFMIPVAVASTNFQQGQLRPTGGSLDFAIEGSGFFTVQLPNGDKAYTRDGEFQLNGKDQLVTKEGYPVLSDGGPVQFDPGNPAAVSISATGQISQGGDVKGHLQVVNFSNPNQLTATDYGYLLANQPGMTPTPVAGDTAVRQGFLEAANSSPTGEMGGLINTMRIFEANQKVLQMQNDRMGEVISTLGGTSS
ncbi:MAG TPA: flagellar hook-basal body protein [Candidatus Baltobacteraceae bacterium]|nr:flagellar hook-basal body protein [Candidatus Baltobacteraceae bacterium]